MSASGHVFWLCGLSGAGKSTLAQALSRDLKAGVGVQALMLDGDRLRSGLSDGLGFGDADRSENLRRAAEVARLGVESGLVVIAAFITPREEQRRRIAAIVGPERISLIHVDAALSVCRRRDVKGLYARGVKQMTGVDSEFEPPLQAALKLETDAESLADSAAKLLAFARRCRMPACEPV